MPSKRPAIQLSTRDQKEIGRWLTSHGTPQQVWPCAAGSCGPRPPVDPTGPLLKSWRSIERQSCCGEGALRKRVSTACGMWHRAEDASPLLGQKIEAIVNATLQARPKGMTQWSCRSMAKNQNVSKSTVSNIWRSHNLKPHRVRASNCRGTFAFWRS